MTAHPGLDDTRAGDADDDLRALVSAILSDPSQDGRDLSDVAALCRTRPACAPKLQALVDRYHRLGCMPAAQHRQITARIRQTLAAPGASTETATPSEAASAAAIGVGAVLRERYELQALLGRGRMAAVYRALDRQRLSLGFEACHVALKVLAPPHSHPAGIAALGREFQSAQRLSHPGVIRVHDIDRDGEAWFYSMELLEGLRLGELLQRLDGPLPRRYALAIVRDVGAAIAHAHSRGTVHADLGPHHIMLTADGQVRVLDFGGVSSAAREPWISDFSPPEQVRRATSAYASCEQLQGWTAEPRDDAYALACIAYQLLAGRHPFDQRPALDARAQRLHARRPPGLGVQNWRALRHGLAWTRDQRPRDIGAWLWRLGVEDAAPGLPPLSRLVAARPPRIWLRRSAAAVLIMLGLSLCALAFELQDGRGWQRDLAAGQAAWHDAWHDAWQRLRTLADGTAASTRAALGAAGPRAPPAAEAPGAMAPPAAVPRAADGPGGRPDRDPAPGQHRLRSQF